MPEIGRLDFALGLRRLAELAGPLTLDLGEQVVPTVVVADIHDKSPFSISLPWSITSGVIAAVAAQYSWAAMLGDTPLGGGWVQVDRIHILGDAAGFTAYIQPLNSAAVPALATSVIVDCNRQTDPAAKRRLPEAYISYGASATVPVGVRGLYVGKTTADILTIEGSWSFQRGGALAVVTSVVNRALTVSFEGTLHMTTTK